MTEVSEAPAGAAGYDIAPLLKPLQVGGLQLRNRFVMPGMQRNWCVDGAPDRRLREYYRRRVLGGAALIISESCAVDHPAASRNPVFARITADTRQAWHDTVEGVHEAGGRMFLQLWHQGAVDTETSWGRGPEFQAVSPSGFAHPGEPFGRAATQEDLDSIRAAYVRGALDAQAIGADGVELHAAHGFLMDQFLWPVTNKRDDRYGGPVTGRATFPAEVASAVRAAVGPDFVISMRLSQWKESDFDAAIVDSPAELGQLIPILRGAGVDVFHVSTRRFWSPEWEGSDLGLAGWVKSFTDAPVIAVGSVGLDIDVMATLTGSEATPTGSARLDELVRRFERGDFDLVSIGRSQIGDPDFITKMAEGRISDVRPFRRDDTTRSEDVVGAPE